MVNYNPITASPPLEVPLKNSPLIRVIAQVNFPAIVSIEKSEYIGAFQEAIREKYPVLHPEQTQGVTFGIQGIIPIPPQVTWRFMDTPDNWTWRVSLAPNFVALEAKAYLSRSDFLQRLENILVALNENFAPKFIERFGLRYIDRVISPELRDIASLVKPEIAGMMSASFKEAIHQTINECIFTIPTRDEQIAARWGLMQPGVTFDSSAIDRIDEECWILDLDMSLAKNRGFSVENLMSEGKFFAERLYTFFRWAVNDDFLQRFGGEL